MAIGNLLAPSFGVTFMPQCTIVHYIEGIVSHGQRDCPEGYGRVHPIISREIWSAPKWYAGGLIERWMDIAHQVPGVRGLVCAVWCSRYQRHRGPWKPLAVETFDIPWERSLHPERRARYARFERRES